MVLGLFPHAHYLATKMRSWLTLPDGTYRTIDVTIPLVINDLWVQGA